MEHLDITVARAFAENEGPRLTAFHNYSSKPIDLNWIEMDSPEYMRNKGGLLYERVENILYDSDFIITINTLTENLGRSPRMLTDKQLLMLRGVDKGSLDSIAQGFYAALSKSCNS